MKKAILINILFELLKNYNNFGYKRFKSVKFDNTLNNTILVDGCRITFEQGFISIFNFNTRPFHDVSITCKLKNIKKWDDIDMLCKKICIGLQLSYKKSYSERLDGELTTSCLI